VETVNGKNFMMISCFGKKSKKMLKEPELN